MTNERDGDEKEHHSHSRHKQSPSLVSLGTIFSPSLSSSASASGSGSGSGSPATGTGSKTTHPPPKQPTVTPATPLQALTTHVRVQTTQARRLFAQKCHTIPETERTWMETTIRDTEDAIRGVDLLTESIRIEQETSRNGKIGVKAQIKWLLRDGVKAKEKRERLVLCHRSLVVVLGRLQGVHVATPISMQGQEEGEGYLEGPSPTEMEVSGPEGPQEQAISRIASPVASTVYTAPARQLQQLDSPVWDLSAQLQDAGMEVVTPETAPPVPPKMPLPPKIEITAGTCSVASSTVGEPSPGDLPSTKLDNELLDMLSWRCGRGRGLE
ncbi:hypothetical protein BJX61DRAFT_551451 [Aspergillus egyptiacus]|nr:hypothetical protein BJX61DRAFT_551451 [Aspergillus egyptiacus]